MNGQVVVFALLAHLVANFDVPYVDTHIDRSLRWVGEPGRAARELGARGADTRQATRCEFQSNGLPSQSNETARYSWPLPVNARAIWCR